MSDKYSDSDLRARVQRQKDNWMREREASKTVEELKFETDLP